MVYRIFFRLVFRRMDPERAHAVGFGMIRFFSRVPGLSHALRGMTRPDALLTTRALGLEFPAPFGLAAGFDKEAHGIVGLADIGFPFVEVGTITARAQPGNPAPRLFRLLRDRALINRMGFNNPGADAAARHLRRERRRLRRRGAGTVVGVNIGKTKSTPLDDAAGDYAASTRRLAPLADYLVVNVSSPNTPGLRSLQAVDQLRPILETVRATADEVSDRHVPLLVKIAPDLSSGDVDAVARLALELELDGIVAVNTTTARTGLGLRTPMAEVEACGEGGLSGAPLRSRSLEVLTQLRTRVGERMALISVGGVENSRDVWARLEAGASLVQGYTGFLYFGPFWVARINRYLVRRMRREGISSVDQIRRGLTR